MQSDGFPQRLGPRRDLDSHAMGDKVARYADRSLGGQVEIVGMPMP